MNSESHIHQMLESLETVVQRIMSSANPIAERVQKLIEELDPVFDMQSHVDDRLESIGDQVNFKSRQASQAARVQGNVFYCKKKLQESLKLYSQSVATAPLNSDELAMAYSNRSAVLRTMERYSDCLIDIQRALDNGYPESQRFKLLLRRAQCQRDLGQASEAVESFQRAAEYLERQTDLSEEKKQQLTQQLEREKMTVTGGSKKQRKQQYYFPECSFQLSYGPSKEAPCCASSAVKIEYNETLGRHLVATRDIEIGDVLVVEDPYAWVINEDETYFRCGHCFQYCFNPLPCSNCIWVMFCSEACHTEANKKYHEVECPVLSRCLSLDEIKSEDDERTYCYLVIRVLATAGIDNWMPYLKLMSVPNLKEQSKEEKRTKGFNADGMYDSTDFNTIFNLVSHESDQPYYSFFCSVNSALRIAKCLKVTNNYTQTLQLASLCFKLILAMKTNALTAQDIVIPTTAMCREIDLAGVSASNAFGTVIQPFCSLLSHSCLPNCGTVSQRKTWVCIAILPIIKGSPVTCMYTQNSMHISIEDRKVPLKEQFRFDCQCEACFNNWPLMSGDRNKVPLLLNPMDLILVNFFSSEITIETVGPLLWESESYEEFIKQVNMMLKPRMKLISRLFKNGELNQPRVLNIVTQIANIFTYFGNLTATELLIL